MLEVREQTRLSLKQMLVICFDSIAYRLLRSLVTVFIIAVAIAFLATILMESELQRSARLALNAHVRELAAYSRLLRALSEMPSDERLAQMAVRALPGSVERRNITRWAGLDEAGSAAFAARSATALRYVRFFETIPVGRRVLLIEQQTGLAVFDWLKDPANRAAFAGALEQMRSLKIPGSRAAFNTFLDIWPAYRAQLDTMRDNYDRMIKAVESYAAPEGLNVRFRNAIHEGRTDALFSALRERGYGIAAADTARIVGGCRYQIEVEWASAFVNQPGVRRTWNRRYNEKFSPAGALAACARDPARIAWIRETLAQEKADAGFDGDRFLAVARAVANNEKILAAGRQWPADTADDGGTDNSRTYWLVFVSFMVCVVGIANAMLMSVLERFKEIATMKCLGARNGTIAFLFVAESLVLGTLGGIVGVIGGAGIALSRQSWIFGGMLFEQFSVSGMAVVVGLSFGCSLLLTALASLYPAHVAARMPPMAAMRVD